MTLMQNTSTPSLRIRCPGCGETELTGPQALGKHGRCRRCGLLFQIPGGAPSGTESHRAIQNGGSRAGLIIAAAVAGAVVLAIGGYVLYQHYDREAELRDILEATSAHSEVQTYGTAPSTGRESDPSTLEESPPRSSSVEPPPSSDRTELPTLPPAPSSSTEAVSPQSLVSGLDPSSSLARQHTSQQVLSGEISYQEWTTAVSFRNPTGQTMSLGNSMALFEVPKTGDGFEGVAVFRTSPGKDDTDPALMGLPDAEMPSSIDSFLLRHAGAYSIGAGETDNKDVRYFGLESLPPGGSHTFSLRLRMSRWVEWEGLSEVRLVLPEMEISGAHFRIIAHFARQDAGDRLVLSRTEVIRLEPQKLQELLTASGTDALARNLALNWLFEISPDTARPSLVRIGQSTQNETLLYTCLRRSGAVKESGLVNRALGVATDDHRSTWIRAEAVRYLGEAGAGDALPTIARLAKSEDDALARAGISALGSLGTPGANSALLDLLDRQSSGPQVAPIAAALLQIHEPSAVKRLQKLAEQGNSDVLLELAYAGLPETFDTFVRLASGSIAAGHEQSVFEGLAKSGGERAIPILVKQLGSTNADVRRAAASGLASQAEHGAAAQCLESALAATDPRVAETLFRGLDDAHWSARGAERKIAAKLHELSDPYAQYAIVKLLRSDSGNAMGPLDLSDFQADPNSWIKSWSDWAAQAH